MHHQSHVHRCLKYKPIDALERINWSRHDKMGFKWENPRIVSKLAGNVYLSIVKYEFNIFICVHSNLGTFISIEKYTPKEDLISL